MKRFVAALAICATAASAQQPFLETFEVRLHDLEIVVTDREGKPVRGLTREDFLVYENGKQQEVTNFSVYDLATSRASSVSSDPSAPATEGAQNAAALAPPPRRFIFFVDDMGVRQRAREALLRDATALVDQVQPGDLIAVVRPTGEKRLVQPFTTDIAAARKVLAQAIESCKFNNASSGQNEIEELIRGMESARDSGDRAYARMTYEQRVALRSSQRLGQLRALVASMAGIEGRKVLVVLTNGIPSMPAKKGMTFGYRPLDIQQPLDLPVGEWGQLGDLTPLIDELGRTAAANGVTIYALEPEVPLDVAVRRVTAGSNAKQSVMAGGHARVEEIVPSDTFGDIMHFRGQTLRSLTERSGGKFFRGIGTIDDVFRQVASDLSSYYSLAYRATGEEGKVRRVEVRIRNRPELDVRTRTEVMDRPKEREMSDLVASSLLFPREINELGVTLVTGKPERTRSAVRIPIDVVMPLASLTFLPTGKDRYEASFDLHYIAASVNTDFSSAGHQRQTVEITKEQYETRRGRNYRFKSAVEVWSGPTRIAIGVMDTVSHQVGFRTKDVIAR